MISLLTNSNLAMKLPKAYLKKLRYNYS